MHLVVVGGGTATNAIAPAFHSCAHEISYVMPISDNGGSTSEILRVFGGPAIGDARSRLVRLIDVSPLRQLLAFRLSSSSETAASEWQLVVNGSHSIWTEVTPYMKAMYRSFLVEVHSEILKRTTTMRAFDFSCASIGNLLLTGARMYFGTLEAAIEFVLHTNRVPQRFSVLPCINSNFSYHLAAELQNGQIVMGQSQISHPDQATESDDELEAGSDDDDSVLFSHPSLRRSQIRFTKHEVPPLQSGIKRVYYINSYGDEIRPKVSSRVTTHLQTADAVVFSVGSLYTSILPVMQLRGFAKNMPRKRIAILNGGPDRETENMSSEDCLHAIENALAYSIGEADHEFGGFVTDVVYPKNRSDVTVLEGKNINCVPASCPDGRYNIESLADALGKCLGTLRY